METHITNSYLNPLLQLFKFTPLVRNLALYHAASSCIADGCLLCEMGFLFDMLEKADGLSCQATNFLRAFSSISEGWFRHSNVKSVTKRGIAARLQVLEENAPQNTLEVRIQAANRFLLDQIAFDSRRVFPSDSKLDQVRDAVNPSSSRLANTRGLDLGHQCGISYSLCSLSLRDCSSWGRLPSGYELSSRGMKYPSSSTPLTMLIIVRISILEPAPYSPAFPTY